MLYTSQYECETAFLVSLPRDEVTASMSLARGVLLISAGKGARAGMERGLPNPRNVRRHPPEQIAKLCRNIETFGFTTALAVDEDRVILVGHGRLEAAARVGLAEVPCLIIEGLASTHARVSTRLPWCETHVLLVRSISVKTTSLTRAAARL